MNHAHDTVTSWQHEIDNKAFIARRTARIDRENTKNKSIRQNLSLTKMLMFTLKVLMKK